MADSGKVGENLMPTNNIKSVAVVKYVSMETPARFLQLQPNTNLNEPPANWLHGRSKWEHFLQDASNRKTHSSFSSFNMAHSFPDMAGEVDVISDSENIKKLLKIPYTKGTVSMMVHRIGNSLLLDEFDVHKHLLRQQQEDWKWLKKFYHDTIIQNIQEKEKNCVARKKKSRDYLQNQDMFSKFLYYSVAENEEATAGDVMSSCDQEHVLDKPDQAIQALPDPFSKQSSSTDSEFQRTVVWTFEDIRMLIGTDLPIFGGGTHPCVSLRLRDMRKPINVLTGIDYWLDNLMCNVPELAMCYHLDGLVQDYELVKTEDIPDIEGSKFSQEVVRDIAQNILSFLKSNATKQGHTYWLFKGSGDDIVKLYDLTTLCDDIVEDRSQNPFTVPVGILLYRVARNMRQRMGRKHSGTIYTLLKNALLLLDKDKHSQLVTSASYLLSDLYVPDNMVSATEVPSSSSSDESDLEEENFETDEDSDDNDKHKDENRGADQTDESASTTSVAVQTLCIADTVKPPSRDVVQYPPVCGNTEERCQQALQHISQGLVCLDSSASEHLKASERLREELENYSQTFANPDEAIPMHYEPLFRTGSSEKENSDSANSSSESINRSHGSASGRENPSHLLLWKSSDSSSISLPHNSWHCLSKTLLLRKAALAYYGLADSRLQLKKYGQSLRFLKLALKSFETVQNLLPAKAEDISNLLCSILSLLGDVHLMLAHNSDQVEVYREDLTHVTEEDTIIVDSIGKQLNESAYGWLNDFTPVAHLNMVRSQLCYDEAVRITSGDHKRAAQCQVITKRLGNVRNELGVHHMNQASHLIQSSEAGGEPGPRIQEEWNRSSSYFESAIQAFEEVDDKINMALVYSNTGRLMRLCAQAFSGVTSADEKREFSPRERHYFSKAIENYQHAVQLLERRSRHGDIWDSITWELSSSYFAMATSLQDNAPLSSYAQEQVEKEVTELMTKALKYCDTETGNARQPMCQYRAATIHHRLASLYHNSYRNQIGEQKKKHLRMLAEIHYDKACRLFLQLDSPCEQLRVLLERVAMCEFQLSNQNAHSSKNKTLQMALGYLLDAAAPLSSICKQLQSEDAEDIEGYHEELTKLLSILQSRLTFVLLNLIKNVKAMKKGKTCDEKQLTMYKKMYSLALTVSSTANSTPDLTTRCQQLQTLFQDLILSSRDSQALGDT